MNVTEQARMGKEAWQHAILDGATRKAVLETAAELIIEREAEIDRANREDITRSAAEGMSLAMQDRLRLSSSRIADMAEGLREVAALPDPLGQIQKAWTLPNGLEIKRVSVPLGLVGIIYEARPNVTIEAGSLIFKAGNAVILRGGSAARRSNEILVEIMQEALRRYGLDAALIQLLDDPTREGSLALMRCHEYVDVLIPRGGKQLIAQVVEDASVPVIRTGEGNCHLYVDETADPQMALAILLNGKMQRPSVCNALETFLVHKKEAGSFLPMVAEAMGGKCELRICAEASAILGSAYPRATEEDYATEYNDYILTIKVVAGVDEAIEHINRYGTGHSEAIVTEDLGRAERFLNAVDAAAVYLNASTRFTDGAQFGFGGELGISTQKLHARGPMGLEALVSYKYKIYGDGQIRA